MLRPEVIKVEENMGEKLHGIGLGNDLLDVRPKAQATKEKRRNGTALNFKQSVHQRTQREKATYGMGEKICKSSV